MNTNPKTEVGRRAVQIALVLWPALKLFVEGSTEDRNGTDATLRQGTRMVQIKGDEKIAKTGNLYIELYEKTYGKPYQRWRHSPMNGDAYIFVTLGKAIWISIDALAKASAGRVVRQINDTSIGILIPLNEIPNANIKKHDLWHNHMLL